MQSRTRRLQLCLLAFCVLSCSTNVRAQITIDRLYPPVAGVGETQVTAEGKISEWPCEIICDRAEIVVTADETEGRLKVIVPKDVAPGVAWIRLAGQRHASRLIPLLVTQNPMTREAGAANNHYSEAQQVEMPAVIAGRIGKSGEVDCYSVSVKQNETLVVSVIANEVLRSPMDALLQITDTKGNVLAQADDDRGLDPQLIFHAAKNMEVVVRVFAFPETPNSTVGLSGSTKYVYALRMTAGKFLDHAHPILVGDSNSKIEPTLRGWNSPQDTRTFAATSISPPTWYCNTVIGWHWSRSVAADANTVLESTDPNAPAKTNSLPVVFAGQISMPKQVDRLRFKVQKGKSYTSLSYSRGEAFRVDTVLRVIDTKTEKEIVRKDDISRTKFDTEISFKAREDAELELQVSDAVDAYGLRHSYAVLIREAKPSVSLSVSEDHFELASGGKREVEVNVDRENGYDKKLKFVVNGLPKGVTVADMFSEPKGDTAKTIKLTITAAKDVSFHGSVQFLAIEMDGEKRTDVTHAANYQLLDKLDVKDIWLTVGVEKK